ncbi:NAD(P)/FAD-dependent oxidoreductase [Prauserella muralis]|uniref:Pyridine nucleotide-disulfide oxidoreductase n=1 Tax=Prauserella muralis TaxID=588067 RepID=A0A2V4BC29_9PSEU|nr:FAD-dependent oxidoreductase [Prauserella muralis]PXY32820.1 pyridine nucleotide-disulfide oxidoreductase [Prauserella muralis]TWE24024.1 NADH dehydrogenase FAD-containing subunit [Prauserella muralis]
MAGNTEVVVIGGGYAGVMAANRLTRRDDVTVTLVNSRPAFVQRVRLHQLVGGSDDAVVDYRDVLAEGVRLVVGTVAHIETAERSVTLESGDALGYDYLVYAVGSGSADPGVPGAAEFAYPAASLEQAQRLRSVLEDTPLKAPVTVVGGGPLGIETAAELAELGRTVTLVCGERLGPYLHPRGRRSVAKGLSALNVTVLDGPGATVAAVTAEAVRLAEGRELPSAVTVWTAGFGVPDLARRSGLSTDAAGRLLTDETLTSVDDERIVATGDAAAPSGLPLRMSCQAALPLGTHAADTVLSRIAGERPADFDRGIGAMCVSLGRRIGVFQFARFDDTAIGLHVSGRLGAKLKESACQSPVKQLAHEARKPGSHRWPVKDSTRRRRVEAQRAEAPAGR